MNLPTKRTLARVNYFRTAGDLREWFRRNHATAGELWVGFYKVATGTPTITWPQSVDEALCVGWIDGLRKRIDDRRYAIRFSPRREGSTWSSVNIKRASDLKKSGLMQATGLAAFARRKRNRSGVTSYEHRGATLGEPYAASLRRNPAAWTFYRSQPPGYQKATNWWVVSAKLEATRLRRLDRLIADSARGLRIEMLRTKAR